MYITDKLIILVYPPQCGGKFIINSLALGSNAVVQDSFIALQQFNDEFSKEDTFNMYLLRLAEMQDEWDDMKLGDSAFFPDDDYSDPAGLKQTIEHDYFFFATAHDDSSLNELTANFPNARIIQLVNCNEFVADTRPTHHPCTPAPTVVDDAFIWDSKWLLSEADTVYNIELLYHVLGIKDFNRKYIQEYYKAWKSCIRRMPK